MRSAGRPANQSPTRLSRSAPLLRVGGAGASRQIPVRGVAAGDRRALAGARNARCFSCICSTNESGTFRSSNIRRSQQCVPKNESSRPIIAGVSPRPNHRVSEYLPMPVRNLPQPFPRVTPGGRVPNLRAGMKVPRTRENRPQIGLTRRPFSPTLLPPLTAGRLVSAVERLLARASPSPVSRRPRSPKRCRLTRQRGSAISRCKNSPFRKDVPGLPARAKARGSSGTM
jgi:hypothetical protein